MSWSQDYSVQSYLELLVKLTGVHPEEVLEDRLAKDNIHVISKEEIVLDDGMFDDVIGIKVTLSDGRVFVPKLTEQVTEDGNYGLDVYEYHLEGETPDVKRIGVDTSDPNVDVYDVPTGYGETDEADLESDGEGFPCGWDS